MNKKQKAQKSEEPFSNDTLDLIYEEIDDPDKNLEEYLEFCRVQYWRRQADGSLPWPMYEDDELEIDEPEN